MSFSLFVFFEQTVHSLLSSCKVWYMLITRKMQLYIVLAFWIPLLSYIRNCFIIILFNMSKRHHDRIYSEKNFPLKELLKGTTWVLKDLWWDIQFSKKVRKFCQKIIEKLGNFIIQNHWSPRTRSGFPIEGRAQYKGLKIETNQEEQDSENRSVAST